MSQPTANINLVNPPGIGPIIRADLGKGAGASRDFFKFQKGGSETFSVDVNGLPDPGGGDAKRMVTIPVGDIVADSDALVPYLIRFSKAVVITAIKYWVDTASADGTTNSQTITIKEDSGDAQVVQAATAGADPGIAQATVTDMGSVTNGTLAAGVGLYATFTKGASGLALSGLTFQVEFTLGG